MNQNPTDEDRSGGPAGDYAESNSRMLKLLGMLVGAVVLGVMLFSSGLIFGSSSQQAQSMLDRAGFRAGEPVELDSLETEPVFSAERGKPAPDFAYHSLEGETGRLSDFRGRRVLINFWATWCPPCKEEMPRLVKANRRYSDTWGFKILAVATSQRSSEQKVREFSEEQELNFPVLYDLDNDVFQRYGISSFPTSYIIDARGNVDAIHIGPMTGEEIKFYLGPGSAERDFSEERPVPQSAPDTVTGPGSGESGGSQSALN